MTSLIKERSDRAQDVMKEIQRIVEVIKTYANEIINT